MDPSRKANREDHEITLQYKSRQEAQGVDELYEDKLKELLAHIRGLEQTPSEAGELQRRIKLFGDCQRIADETSGQYYARLHSWLGRDMPQTKLPLHAPRQTGD
jgi:hypothetical protein